MLTIRGYPGIMIKSNSFGKLVNQTERNRYYQAFLLSICTNRFLYVNGKLLLCLLMFDLKEILHSSRKFSLNFSRSSFVISVHLFHPYPSLFLYGLLLSLWCFSIPVNYYFSGCLQYKGNFVQSQNNSK